MRKRDGVGKFVDGLERTALPPVTIQSGSRPRGAKGGRTVGVVGRCAPPALGGWPTGMTLEHFFKCLQSNLYVVFRIRGSAAALVLLLGWVVTAWLESQ